MILRSPHKGNGNSDHREKHHQHPEPQKKKQPAKPPKKKKLGISKLVTKMVYEAKFVHEGKEITITIEM